MDDLDCFLIEDAISFEAAVCDFVGERERRSGLEGTPIGQAVSCREPGFVDVAQNYAREAWAPAESGLREVDCPYHHHHHHPDFLGRQSLQALCAHVRRHTSRC